VAVRVRVRNASGVDFDAVRITLPDSPEVDLGAVRKAAHSAFVSAAKAYRYASFRVRAGGRDLVLQPYDYSGEQELRSGDYAYALGISDGRLTCTLERAT
jgi:hypothetical protein